MRLSGRWYLSMKGMNVARACSHRKGSVIIYVVVSVSAMLGIATIAVDYGRVELAKTQLRAAADAAAMYAATGLSDSTFVAKAQAVASQNTCDGVTIALQAGDIVSGTWANGTFTPGGFSPNAVQINAQRSAARGTAIPLYFGNILGISSCDVHASAVAIPAGGPGYGFIGLDSVTMSGNGNIDSYNATTGAIPRHQAHERQCRNHGRCKLSGNQKVYGNAGYGTSYSASGNSGIVAPGSATKLSTTLNYPDPTLPGSYTNMGSLSGSGNGSINLTTGDYYFTKFSVSGNYTVNISGQVNVYVSGVVKLSGNFSTSANLPSNFHIYVTGTSGVTVSGNSTLYASVYAPTSAITVSGNSDFFGNIIGKSIKVSGNLQMHYDESLSSGTQTGVALVE